MAVKWNDDYTAGTAECDRCPAVLQLVEGQEPRDSGWLDTREVLCVPCYDDAARTPGWDDCYCGRTSRVLLLPIGDLTNRFH